MKKIYFVIMKTLYNVGGFFLLWIAIGFMLVGFINSIAGEIGKMPYEGYAHCSFLILLIIGSLYCVVKFEKKSDEGTHSKKLNSYVCICSLVGLVSLFAWNELIADTLENFDNLPLAIPAVIFLITFAQCTVPDF